MKQSNNSQKTLKPKNPKKYTEAVNLGKKLSKTPDITKVAVATQMFELIHDEVLTAHQAGMQITVKLSPGLDDRQIELAAKDRGVVVSALSSYYANSQSENGLLLGFCPFNEAEIVASIETLSKLIEKSRFNKSLDIVRCHNMPIKCLNFPSIPWA